MGTPRAFGDYPPVMNTAQVAEMLGLPSTKTVQVLVRKGRLPAHRLPGVRRLAGVPKREWRRRPGPAGPI